MALLIRKKQRVIADKLQELVEQTKVHLKNENIWVVFSAFEPIAKMEANRSIPLEKIKDLKARIAREDLWEISRFGSGVTFFFYTEEQVEQNTSNGVKKKLTEDYFNLLKAYDEFNYFIKDHYSINIDSKENFDNHYQSNWYYYYK